MKTIAALTLLLCTFNPTGLKANDAAAGAHWSFTGHVKYQANVDSYPENSVFRDLLGSTDLTQSLTARLNGTLVRGRWDFAAAFQFIALHSDAMRLGNSALGLPALPAGVISDDRRWWNLTHTETADADQVAIINRLDRISVGYASGHVAWRFGRQAISWGNGLIFTPMDVFNPFDPTAVDKEYKTGDDMLYGQWLFTSGADLQGIAVVRRNPETGQVESDQSSLAFKYHGFLGGNEFDVLMAEHYGDHLLGLGGIITVGGSIWRGDVIRAETDAGAVFSAVSSINYSWVWGGRNVDGLVEYYFSGFGQRNQNYATDEVRQNPDLFKRLQRGELFTLGRHYLGTSLSIEMSPLFRLTPKLLLNLQDPSALAQLVAQYDWKQDLSLLAALTAPIGPDGSEYGGPQSALNGKYASRSANLFLQLAFYF